MECNWPGVGGEQIAEQCCGRQKRHIPLQHRVIENWRYHCLLLFTGDRVRALCSFNTHWVVSFQSQGGTSSPPTLEKLLPVVPKTTLHYTPSPLQAHFMTWFLLFALLTSSVSPGHSQRPSGHSGLHRGHLGNVEQTEKNLALSYTTLWSVMYR